MIALVAHFDIYFKYMHKSIYLLGSAKHDRLANNLSHPTNIEQTVEVNSNESLRTK